MLRGHVGTVAAVLTATLFASPAWAAKPIPLGTSTNTVTYTTSTGPESYSGDRDYSGVGPTDATLLGGAPNIASFNSVNSFGRRTFANLFNQVIGPDEAAVTHAFFKNDITGDYFPDLLPGGAVTLDFDNITFDQPVNIVTDTILVHVLWDIDQIDNALGPEGRNYVNHHNHHTAAPTFRDFDDFFSPVFVFTNFPVPNYVLGDISPTVVGDGTDTLDISLTLPYALFQNLEDDGQGTPPGFPAPQGFLEPFHFHLEYLVAPVPEPATLSLLVFGGLAVMRRTKRR
ncbi:MAG: PEP-CTERM sorting domain-containing protein [bacterium]|nr:PEP-CTERM sorting domain-containing protein [bacterium]